MRLKDAEGGHIQPFYLKKPRVFGQHVLPVHCQIGQLHAPKGANYYCTFRFNYYKFYLENKCTMLSGVAGSPGTVSGPVKIVRSPSDFSAFRAGDILVAVSTDPAWTPLFSIAKAVITEYGGMLSHGAIVAREYNIPAVLNVKNATSVLKDGQVVAVDGNRGLVSVQ